MLSRASIAGSLAAPLLLAGVAGAQTPGFWQLGLPPGGTSGVASALSQDGSIAAGTSGIPGSPYGLTPGFTWDRLGGRVDFGLGPGMPAMSIPYGMSSNGTVLAGEMQAQGGSPNERAFRRVGNGPLVDLGLLPGEQRAHATGISGDGGIVVGWNEHTVGSYTFAYGQAYRWTESGGMQGLGYLRPNSSFSVAYGISRDGSTIVGFNQADGPFSDFEAFRWRAGEGMVQLPTPPGAQNEAIAYAVNADGSVAVGQGDVGVGPNHAIRWVGTVSQDLGTIPGGYTNSYAYAVDDSGLIVGGVSTGPGGLRAAAIWTPATQMIRLTDYLALHGVAVPADFNPLYVYAISGDGLTFAGSGRNLSANVFEGFVATIPSPGTAVVLLAPAFSRRRRRG